MEAHERGSHEGWSCNFCAPASRGRMRPAGLCTAYLGRGREGKAGKSSARIRCTEARGTCDHGSGPVLTCGDLLATHPERRKEKSVEERESTLLPLFQPRNTLYLASSPSAKRTGRCATRHRSMGEKGRAARRTLQVHNHNDAHMLSLRFRSCGVKKSCAFPLARLRVSSFLAWSCSWSL